MKTKCLRCLNEDLTLFGNDQGILYCRRCIQFGRLNLGDQDPVPILKKFSVNKDSWLKTDQEDQIKKKNSISIQENASVYKPKLKFELTPFQKKISRQALEAVLSHKDCFIYAAAGSGKTEIVLESISTYLKNGKSVCFAISRRQVVLEIADRMTAYFPDLKVTAVCEGYPENKEDLYDSDLIVCTMHQLYRYPHSFDLLIMDEVDAFPYAGNETLQAITLRACKGERLLLSATPDAEIMDAIEQKKMVLCELFQRPHGKPLCVPKIKKCSKWMQVFLIAVECKRLIREKKQILVFVPRKIDGKWLKLFLSLIGPCELIHSQIEDKDMIMNRFRKKEYPILVTTTLLERGITVPDVQVLVYRSDHSVFTCASLIQIFGRVGRAFNNPYGEGVCYCESKSQPMKECVSILRRMNASLQAELYEDED